VYDLTAAIAFAYGNGTAESNNLKSGDASLSCVDYECRMTWEGQADQSAPAIAVRTANPAGEADVVMWGPSNSLIYYHNLPGGKWYPTTIAGANTTYSAPAIAVRPTGEADVVAQGPNNSLIYYHNFPGGPWYKTTVAGPGTTRLAPAIAVRPTGEADVVAMGLDGSLIYYHNFPGGPWYKTTVAGPGTTYSAPAIAVRSANPAGEADVVVQGPSQSLMYYHNLPGKQWYVDTIPGSAGKTFGTPAIGVNSTTGRADIVWVGLYHSLYHTHATPGSPWSEIDIVAGENSTFYPPAIAVRSANPADEIDIVTTAWDGSLNYYYLLPGATYWRSAQIAGLNNKNYGQLTVYPPAIAVRPNGEADVLEISAYELDYFWATPGSSWSMSKIAEPL
jgi:hypothetical protein